MKVYKKIDNLVGGTPLYLLSKIKKELGFSANVFAKLEYFNPTGSVKDRAALYMLKDGIKSGKIDKETVVIEPTSGNIGISLAAFCAAYGLKVVIVMPDTMSAERRKLILSYGGELVLTEGVLGMRGAIAKAKELSLLYPKSFIPSQFDNIANPLAHYETTGREILLAMKGKVDYFVAGVGTGGTISGAGRYLKENLPDVKIIGVEPSSSPVLSGGKAGAHKLQGIGAGFIPPNLNEDILDEVIAVSDEDAFRFARLAAIKEGISVGISSGAALCAAVTVAKHKNASGKNVAVVFPDGGDRYLSVPGFI